VTNHQTIKIGKQTWMTENLSVTKFRNSETIPYYTSIVDFLKAGRNHEPACILYDNNPIKGMLYNFFAVDDKRQICPEGFTIPTEKDWRELTTYCGDEQIAARHLKSASDWFEPLNVPKPEILIETEIGNGLDSFEFNALPMGVLVKTTMFAEFSGFGTDASFWTADTNSFYSGYAWNAYMYYYSSRLILVSSPKRLGMSVRCIKMNSA